MPDLWYYLDSVTPRAFGQARASRMPKRIIKGANPWPTVRDNLSDFRSPGREKVLVLNVLDGKTYGPFSYAKIKKLAVAKNNPYRPSFGTPHPTPISAAQLAIIEIEDTDGSKWYASEDGVTDKRAHALRMPRNVANIQADMLSMQYDSPTKVLVVGRAKKNTGSRTKPMLSWMVNIEGPRGSIDVFDVTAKTREEAKKCVREEGVPIGRKKSETALRFGKREVTYGMGRKGYSVIISGPDGPVRFNPYWGVVNDDLDPVPERVYTGPGRFHIDDMVFRTEDDYAEDDIIEMMEPYGVRSQYEVLEAARGPLSSKKHRGTVRRVYGAKSNPLPIAAVAIYAAKKIVDRGGRALWQHVMGLSVSRRATWLEENSPWIFGASAVPIKVGRQLGPFQDKRKTARKRAYTALARSLGEPRIRRALEIGGSVVSLALNNGLEERAIEIGTNIAMKLGASTWKKVKGMDTQTRADWLEAAAPWVLGPTALMVKKAGKILPFGKTRGRARKKAFLSLSRFLGDPDVQKAVEAETKAKPKKNPAKKRKKKKLRKVPRHGPELATVLKQRRAGSHTTRKGKKGYKRKQKHQARGNPACVRCEGAGYIPAFAHIDGGTCFSCKGAGR